MTLTFVSGITAGLCARPAYFHESQVRDGLKTHSVIPKGQGNRKGINILFGTVGYTKGMELNKST